MKTAEEILWNHQDWECGLSLKAAKEAMEEYAQQFTLNRERVIEVLESYLNFKGDAINADKIESIADELLSLPDHSEDVLDMISEPSKEEQVMYPEEFVKWMSNQTAIPELYQYWLNNIAKNGGKE